MKDIHSDGSNNINIINNVAGLSKLTFNQLARNGQRSTKQVVYFTNKNKT